ncbi:SWIM zinc finger family protein [Nocardiopsis valliformis]|uniref:SWIM zinc finger family protein n=1 Tax=Nocardiopsis valliformis TaxID=239974 RepID=UPI000349C518|nr:SWIM zinc finger family protein [Nocardiopsis valliformis]
MPAVHGPVCESWWSARLLQGISDGDIGRLSRGRTYYRQGAVREITVDADHIQVIAFVQGSRGRPYRVSVAYPAIDDTRWSHLLDDLAQDPDAAADLLAGELPEATEEVFARHGLALFPDSVDDIDIHCTCPDRGGYPCKHGAAAMFAWASLLDENPLLLFAWLGRTEEEVLDALESTAPAGSEGELAVEVVPLSESATDFWSGGDLTPLARPRPFDPLSHWEGSTLGVASGLAPMYAALTRGAAPQE